VGRPPDPAPTPLIYWGGLSVTGNGDLPLATQRRVESIASDRSPFAVFFVYYEVFEKPPKFHMLDNSEEIAERGLKGRAALFILETGDLFVNGLYEAVTRTVDDIEPDFAGQADAELIRELVTSAARRQLAFRVGKATVFALAKRANEDWDEQALGMALAKESLSMAADNYLESLAAVRREVKEGIKVSRLQAA
jgi:hypothetical protein